MYTYAITFLKDESGAVTVDWVVLTAAIVGIALAVIGVIYIGLKTTTIDVGDQISGVGSLAASLFGG